MTEPITRLEPAHRDRHLPIYAWLIAITMFLVGMSTLNWLYNVGMHQRSLQERGALGYLLEQCRLDNHALRLRLDRIEHEMRLKPESPEAKP